MQQPIILFPPWFKNAIAESAEIGNTQLHTSRFICCKIIEYTLHWWNCKKEKKKTGNHWFRFIFFGAYNVAE